MNTILKYALLAIFLVNNGWAQSNQLEASEAIAQQENHLVERAEICPASGIQCVPDCSNKYRQCVGGNVFPTQDTAPGTLCKAGVIVHAAECAIAAPVTTQAPVTQATQAPPAQATQRPSTQATQRPPAQATSKPVTPTPAATTKPTVAPTAKPSVPTTGLCDVVPVASEPLKFLVPLYVYPGGAAWDSIAAGGLKVPTVAIINPNSGPLAKPDSAYTSGMTKLTNNNVEMVGYVYTTWGQRPIAEVKKDIDTYVNNWPGLKGIFFDEGSAEAKDIPFYKNLYDYVLSKGYTQVILNPGVQPAQGYADISTNIVIFEDYGTKFTAPKTYSITCAPNAAAKAGYKYKFSGMAHTVSGNTDSTAIIKNMEKSGIGMVYVTDGAGGCCTYNNLVSYYGSQASAIQSINKL